MRLTEGEVSVSTPLWSPDGSFLLALRERAAVSSNRTHSGHLLLGVMASRDPIVSGTFAEHDLRLRQVRPVVQKWGRRAV